MNPLRVKSVRDLGAQFTRNTHRIIGLDGAFSIPLDKERTLWFFGDTLIGRRFPNQSLWYVDGQPVGPADMSGHGGIERMINNSGAIVRNSLADFSVIVDVAGKPKCLIPLEDDEHPDRDRIWCQHGIAIDGRIYLSFIKVRMLPVGACPFPVCFEIVGSGLAVCSERDWDFYRITRNNDSILWPAEQPHFATALLTVPNDPFIYLYGTVNRDNLQQCFLARTRRLEAVDEYEYLAGPEPAWYRDIAMATPLFSNMPSELSVSFNPYLNGYLAVHSLDLTGQIVALISPTPWGPWSSPSLLWTVRMDDSKPLPYPRLTYAAKEHPELSRDDGRIIYVTYVEFEEYWPRLVEIELQ